MKTTIHREGDRVWIESAKGWSLHERPSSVHAAQGAVMWAVGEGVTCDYLLGVSGLAFRMQVSKKAHCPSSPHSFCGCKCVARSAETLPWHVRVFEMKPEQKEQVQGARQAVVDSIERGVPVQYGNEEDGITIGYQRKGEEWICLHPLRDRGQKSFVATQWPWGVAVFTHPKSQVPTRRELALGALDQAVKMARTEDAETYWLGFKAWDDYIARIKAMDTADEKTKSEALLGNAWIYECLASYRASAARYLREVACEFESPVVAHLMQAAGLYEQISSKILSDEEHAPARIAPYRAVRMMGNSGRLSCAANKCAGSKRLCPWSGRPLARLRRPPARRQTGPSPEDRSSDSTDAHRSRHTIMNKARLIW